MDNLHRFENTTPLGTLRVGDLFCFAWDPYLRGSLGEVLKRYPAKRTSATVVLTTLGLLGPDLPVIKVEQS